MQQQVQALNVTSFKRAQGNFVFSILIPTWNNLEYLKLCVESIRKNSAHSHQIIIHVNEGADGTLEWVEAQKDIDYTYSTRNIGVCYPLNIGRRLVDADYIVYINDDMYLCPGWDQALLDEIKSIGHKYFFLSATAIEPEPSSNCVITKDYGRSVKDFKEELLLKEFDTLAKDDWSGATWPPNIVHKDIWDKIGGYSIEFSPGMYSDPDFSMKLWQVGVRIFKGIARSRAYHFGSKSTKRIVKNHGYYTFISKWGFTSSTLTKYFLRRGEKYTGPLEVPELPFIVRLKNAYKRIISGFYR